jgi:uncharacterized protein
MATALTRRERMGYVLERVGLEALPEIEHYLLTYRHQNILLLHDLYRPDVAPAADRMSVIGYRQAGCLVAVQAFYRYGRWMPHFADPVAIPDMLDDMHRRPTRWLMGVRAVVDPLWQRLATQGYALDYDEQGFLAYVDASSLKPYPRAGVRPATFQNVDAIARLRMAFDIEYFGTLAFQISHAWCVEIAEQYVRAGAYVAEYEGQVVSMVATEATIPGLAQIGAVFTMGHLRSQGLARGVVSAICQDKLQKCERVTLVVKEGNRPALRAYESLGFRHWEGYRMARLR